MSTVFMELSLWFYVGAVEKQEVKVWFHSLQYSLPEPKNNKELGGELN